MENISNDIIRLFSDLSNKHNVDINLIDISLQNGKLVVYSANDKWCRDALTTLEQIDIKNPSEKDLFYPSALTWMWNYCTWLGKFTDSRGKNYDLGVYIDDDEVSAAIVSGNEPGDYFSGDIRNRSEKSNDFDWYEEKYKETYKRAKLNNLL